MSIDVPRPLHTAARNGYIYCLQFMLKDCGMSADERDFNGQTPLHAASASSQVACARLLVKYGAPVNSLSLSNKTPLDLCPAESAVENFLKSYLREGDNMFSDQNSSSNPNNQLHNHRVRLNPSQTTTITTTTPTTNITEERLSTGSISPISSITQSPSFSRKSHIRNSSTDKPFLIDGISLEGYLWKSSGRETNKAKGWQKRWFVVDSTSLQVCCLLFCYYLFDLFIIIILLFSY